MRVSIPTVPAIPCVSENGASAMAPERSAHNQRKMLAWLALRSAIEQAGLPCQAHGDGMTVEIGDSDYEPDAVVHCGAKLPGDAITVPNPLIIVEILSPGTSSTDRTWKLVEYFRLPSVHHYLIIWPDKQQVTPLAPRPRERTLSWGPPPLDRSL